VTPTPLPDLPAGVYRHYKGHLYLVLGYARDSNDETRVGVVYIGLDLDGAKSPERMHFRSAYDFHATVWPEDGRALLDCEVDLTPNAVPRFTYVGPSAPLPS
jgi:hypothetical protein